MGWFSRNLSRHGPGSQAARVVPVRSVEVFVWLCKGGWREASGGLNAGLTRYGTKEIVPTRHGPGLQNQPVPARCASTRCG